MIEVVANWLDRLRNKQESVPPPLRGAPANPRLKNYAALSGYAYEYVFEGMRDLPDCREYVFRVSGDRKSWFYLSLRLLTAGTQDWEAGQRRALHDNEKYAAAKLALFAAFDERPNPESMKEPITIDAAQIRLLLEQVGIE